MTKDKIIEVLKKHSVEYETGAGGFNIIPDDAFESIASDLQESGERKTVPEMFKFNINHYVYIQINEHGWKHLKTTVGDDYIKHCIVSHKEIINGEDWYKLQCHEVFSLFPVRGNPVPFNTNIIISWKELTELARRMNNEVTMHDLHNDDLAREERNPGPTGHGPDICHSDADPGL